MDFSPFLHEFEVLRHFILFQTTAKRKWPSKLQPFSRLLLEERVRTSVLGADKSHVGNQIQNPVAVKANKERSEGHRRFNLHKWRNEIRRIQTLTCSPIRCHTKTRASWKTSSVQYQPWHQRCLTWYTKLMIVISATFPPTGQELGYITGLS